MNTKQIISNIKTQLIRRNLGTSVSIETVKRFYWRLTSTIMPNDLIQSAIDLELIETDREIIIFY